MLYLISCTYYDANRERFFAKNAKERDFLLKGIKKSVIITKAEYTKIYKDDRMAEPKIVKG